MTITLLKFCRPLHAFALAGMCTMVGCGDGDPPASSRTLREAGGAGGASATGGNSAPVSSNDNRPPLLPPVQATAGSSAPSMPTIADCAPGIYVGTYDIAMLVTGPITFDLVPSAGSRMAEPCLEFCPDLVFNSEGGQFDASWIGFMGRAKLKGGLDCRTGEFRCEMVDGKFGFSEDPNDPNSPIVGGDLTGQFLGKFSDDTIAGDITFNVGLDMAGTFSVTRSP